MAGAGPLPRTRLEQLVHQLRRTRAEFQQDFTRTAAQLGERLDVSTRQVARWLAGKIDVLPRPAACRVLEQMFGESAERLFAHLSPCPDTRSLLSRYPDRHWSARSRWKT